MNDDEIEVGSEWMNNDGFAKYIDRIQEIRRDCEGVPYYRLQNQVIWHTYEEIIEKYTMMEPVIMEQKS